MYSSCTYTFIAVLIFIPTAVTVLNQKTRSMSAIILIRVKPENCTFQSHFPLPLEAI